MMAAMTRGGYRQVLRAEGVSFLLATSLVARLPVAMVNLAIILRVAHGTGSYARAGVITATYVLGTAVGVPLLGRLADRVGLRPVLVAASISNAAGLVALALIPLRDAGILFVVAPLTGASLPPVAPAVRSLWRGLVDHNVTSSLYAIDATLQEVTFMAGPALVALISALADPSAALAVSGLIGLAGTLAVTAHPATSGRGSRSAASVHEEPSDALAGDPDAVAGRSDTARRPDAVGTPGGSGHGKSRRALGLVRSGALATLALMTLLFLTAIVIVEVTVVAFAGHHHAAHQAGTLLTTWSAGSLVGGLVFGARAARGGVRMVAPLMLGTAVGFAVLALAPSVVVLYGLLFVAGTAIAPGFSCIYELVGRTTPPRASVEAFSWIASAIQVGAAIGSAVGGAVVQSAGARVAMLCASGVGLCTAGVGLGGRRFLQTPQVPEASAPTLR